MLPAVTWHRTLPGPQLVGTSTDLYRQQSCNEHALREAGAINAKGFCALEEELAPRGTMSPRSLQCLQCNMRPDTAENEIMQELVTPGRRI